MNKGRYFSLEPKLLLRFSPKCWWYVFFLEEVLVSIGHQFENLLINFAITKKEALRLLQVMSYFECSQKVSLPKMYASKNNNGKKIVQVFNELM